MNARPSNLKTRRTTFALAVALVVSTGAFAQADEARAKKIAGGSCFLCHGMNGESTSEVFPRLAGQHAEYVAKQLQGASYSDLKVRVAVNLNPGSGALGLDNLRFLNN